jgi:hypothetical protein
LSLADHEHEPGHIEGDNWPASCFPWKFMDSWALFVYPFEV